MSNPSCSLILATYEMPRHLELVLTALDRQSFLDFEILVADDGSGPETRGIIDRFKASARMKIEHIWQEHKGFRKCRILNEALRHARGETLVFLDGDCIPHRDFIRDHFESREKGRFCAGRRVELSEALSTKLTPVMIREGFFDYPNPTLLLDGIRGETEHVNRTIRVTNPVLRKILKMNRIDDLKGCNYSVSKKDLIAINGFDMEYEGYGREDTDIEIRLTNLGLKIKSLKGLALQYHVWHPRREFTPSNDTRLEDAKRLKRVRCEKGLV